MVSQQSSVDFICDQMADAGNITHRKMFGEYGLYCDEKFIGVICEDTPFLKVTEAARKFAPALELAPAYDGAKPSFRIPHDLLDDTEWLTSFVRVVHDSLPVKKK